jgi:hypothetical protein
MDLLISLDSAHARRIEAPRLRRRPRRTDLVAAHC